MLDDYKDTKFYEYAKNLKKYYHAYIFEVSNLDDSYDIILAFAKSIICKNHYTNKNNCLDCNICHLIDNNYYPDLKIIKPDGINIKKDQIQAIQKDLSLKSSNGTNQVYIIFEAEKMNLSAANSLLKFIEEPEDSIFAILVTVDRKQLLPTILSRAILITLKTLDQKDYDLEMLEALTKFLNLIFEKKEEALPYVKESFLDKYKNRDEIITAFNYLEVILDFLINENYQINTFENTNLYDIIKANLANISFSNLIFYLQKIVEFKNDLINVPNLNINLFMDRFIIEMSMR